VLELSAVTTAERPSSHPTVALADTVAFTAALLSGFLIVLAAFYSSSLLRAKRNEIARRRRHQGC
jgi:hypothetical protein